MENNQEMLLGSKGLIQKDEFVMLIAQSLHSLGYGNTASLIESESGISFNPTEFSYLKSQIVNGVWDKCADTLFNMNNLEEKTRGSAMFYVLRMWLLECLGRGDKNSVSIILQRNNFVFQMGQEEIRELTHFITNFNEILIDIIKDQEFDESVCVELRKALVMQLENLLPGEITMSEGRLITLIESVLHDQRDSCVYHNSTDDDLSLYQDHSCGRDQLPTETVQIISDHTKEVWFVKFSHNGQYLASASSDHTAIIWEVPEHGNLTSKHTLFGHQTPVCFLSWSPNDNMLLSCGHEEHVRVWNTDTGECLYRISRDDPILSSCAWLPDEQGLVYGNFRWKSCVHMLRFNDYMMTSWSGIQKAMIVDFAMTPNGKDVIFICSEGEIVIMNVQTGDWQSIKEDAPIVSVSVSEDGEFLMFHLNNQEIHLWHVKGTMRKLLTYRGHRQGRFVIHSCFGGVESAFIASGSEDSRVYIWNRKNGEPLEVLSGHSMTVNCVSWNPKRPQMLASASDDRTIRIWGPTRIDKSKQKQGSSLELRHK